MKKNNWIRRFILIIIGLAFGINVYMINAQRLVGNQMPMPFGYGVAVILSGSMEPEMYKGDMIIVHETHDYKVNDIVVFQDNRMLVTHRIVAINDDGIVTKGDANNVEDAPISLNDIKGEVILCIPMIGTAINMLKSPIATICMIGLALLFIEKSHESDRKKDEIELDKIREEIRRLKEE